VDVDDHFVPNPRSRSRGTIALELASGGEAGALNLMAAETTDHS
jgi:hypothetical protein